MLENVRDNWGKVTDMEDPVRLNEIRDATLSLLNALETLREGRGGVDTTSEAYPVTSRDLILYALGGELHQMLSPSSRTKTLHLIIFCLKHTNVHKLKSNATHRFYKVT